MEKIVMQVGYSYWGFLADKKFNKFGKKLSTPDGNAFYSWTIISELQIRGYEVHQLMPNRDEPYEMFTEKNGDKSQMFKNFCTEKRLAAYEKMHKHMYDGFDFAKATVYDLYELWDKYGVKDFDVILHEWRMLIPGRNDEEALRTNPKEWQPDYLIQTALLQYCIDNKISLIIFDLDYKITREEYLELSNKSPLIHLFELGYKWKSTPKCLHVEIPFDTQELSNGYKPPRCVGFETQLVYIGNRYERDKCIDDFIPDDVSTEFYGNWLQPGYDDCKQKWPFIQFRNRLQAGAIPDVYDKSVCTILMAKEEYYEHGFMTARLLEALYYGCLPLFPYLYGEEIIEKYAGCLSNELTVRNKEDVSRLVKYFTENNTARNTCIMYLRSRLCFMDAYYIVDDITRIAGGYLW